MREGADITRFGVLGDVGIENRLGAVERWRGT